MSKTPTCPCCGALTSLGEAHDVDRALVAYLHANGYVLAQTADPAVIDPNNLDASTERRMDAPMLLEVAAGHMRDRAATYDQPGGERSMGRTVEAFNIITGRTGDRAITESEGWLLMQILKDVRDRQREVPHRDSLEDGIAYSALKAEARLAE